MSLESFLEKVILVIIVGPIVVILILILVSIILEIFIKKERFQKRKKAIGALLLGKTQKILDFEWLEIERVFKNKDMVGIKVNEQAMQFIKNQIDYSEIENLYGYRVASVSKEGDKYRLIFQKVSEAKEEMEDEEEEIKRFFKNQFLKILKNKEAIKQIHSTVSRTGISSGEIYIDKSPLTVINKEGKLMIKVLELNVLYNELETYNSIKAINLLTGKEENIKLHYFTDPTYVLLQLEKELDNIYVKIHKRDGDKQTIDVYLVLSNEYSKNPANNKEIKEVQQEVEEIHEKIEKLKQKDLSEEAKYEIYQIANTHITELIERYKEEEEDLKQLKEAFQTIKEYLEAITEFENTGKFKAYKSFIEKKYKKEKV